MPDVNPVDVEPISVPGEHGPQLQATADMPDRDVLYWRTFYLAQCRNCTDAYGGEARVPYKHLYWMYRNEFWKFDRICVERKIGPYVGS